MSADDSGYADLPDEVVQEEAPFEPEAPAHEDPDEEEVVHDDDLDAEAVVDEIDHAPEEPV